MTSDVKQHETAKAFVEKFDRTTIFNEAIEAAAKVNDAEAEKWESQTYQDEASRLVAQQFRKSAAAIRSLKLPEGK